MFPLPGSPPESSQVGSGRTECRRIIEICRIGWHWNWQNPSIVATSQHQANMAAFRGIPNLLYCCEGSQWARRASHSCDRRASSLGSPGYVQQERPKMPQSQGNRFAADPLTFIVRHQLWDGNVEDHTDQG